MDHVKFMRRLENDRLIKLPIGDGHNPLFVQHSLLEGTSDYFRNALKHEANLGNAEPGTLAFPEDKTDFWLVLLYWIMHKRLPTEKEWEWLYGNNDMFIRCWILGDRYGIPDFQDLVMLEILHFLDNDNYDVAHTIAAFENTPPGSQLRLVLAAEIGVYLEDHESMEYGALDQHAGIVGFSSEVTKAVSDYHRSGVPARIPNGDGTGLDWKEYMVGKGPKQHWVFRAGQGRCDEESTAE